MPIVQASPPPVTAEVPPLTVEPPVRGLLHTWTGWDGSVWNLSDWSAGVFLARGARGLTLSEYEAFSSTSPMLDGARYRGHRMGVRSAFWPLYVFSSSGQQAWLELDRALWRTFQPGRYGTWTVTQPTGERRSLRMRCVDDGDWALTYDPTTFGWTAYAVTFAAEAPLWAGDPVVRQFAAAAPTQFFGGPGVLNISGGSTLAEATIPNPGDVDAWVTWTLYGPFTAATVGVAGATISVPIVVGEGDNITVFTRPDLMQAVSSVSGDVTDLLGAASFAAVPPGGSVPLSLTMAGAGSVAASLEPRFYRAW